MGTLANSLFRAAMGWIRTLCQQIWSTVSAPGQETLISWIGAHWKALALILCAVGLMADFTVYLFRWQPYRVWRSFFARRRHRGEETDPETDPEEAPPAALAAAEGAGAVPRNAEFRASGFPRGEREEQEQRGRRMGHRPPLEEFPNPEEEEGPEFLPEEEIGTEEEASYRAGNGAVRRSFEAEEDMYRPRNAATERSYTPEEDVYRPRKTAAERSLAAEEDMYRPRKAAAERRPAAGEDMYRPRNTAAERRYTPEEDMYRPVKSSSAGADGSSRRTAYPAAEVPMDSPYRRPVIQPERAEPEGTTERFEQAILPRRRRRVRDLLSENGNQEMISPDQLIDRREAYRRPVYPSSWGMDEDDQ